MRAREPDRVGDLDRDGVPVHYELFGLGPATVMLLGCFPVVDGHQWKAQVPYLARHLPGGHDRPTRQRSVGPARLARTSSPTPSTWGTSSR